MTQIYRNHPAVIVKNSVGMSVAAVLIFISWGNPLILLLCVPFIILSVIFWFVSYLTLYEDHAVAQYSFIVKKTKTIPYGKVASINEVQGIFGRMFGWTTVQININSSQNSARPEISFMFSKKVAEMVVPLLKYGILPDSQEAVPQETETVQEPIPEAEPIFRFGLWDSVVFGFVGTNTYSLIMAFVWGLISVVTFITSPGASFVSGIMFIVTGAAPIVMSVLKHADFRVYRTGTTVRMVHGLLTIYDTSFDIDRVNSICIKRAFFPKIMGRCCIQAEVVGINAEKNSTTPNVTLLIPEKVLGYAMERIFPEFITDYPIGRQPDRAKYVLFARAIYWTLGFFGVAAFAILMMVLGYDGFRTIMIYPVIGIATVLSILVIFRVQFLLSITSLGCGEKMFTNVYGIVDTSEYIVQYSKVQITSTVASPRPRRLGLAKLNFNLLTAQGKMKVGDGFFDDGTMESLIEKTVEMSGKGIEKIDVKPETVI